MFPPPSATIIEALRRQLATPLASQAVLAFGDPRIDRHLPGGGLPIGQLHEIGADGIEAETGAVAGGFAAALAAALVRQAQDDRVLLWVAPCCDLYAPGLPAYGIDPGRLIMVQTRTDDETLQAMETALRSGATTVVVGEVGKLTRLAARRLQLACLQHHTTSLLLRRWPHGRPQTRPDPTAAVTRWRVSHAPAQGRDKEGQGLCPWTPLGTGVPRPRYLESTDRGRWTPSSGVWGPLSPAGSRGRAPGLPSPSLHWRVELLHARGGRGGDWIMEMDHAAHSLRVAAVLGDDAVAPRPRAVG